MFADYERPNILFRPIQFDNINRIVNIIMDIQIILSYAFMDIIGDIRWKIINSGI